MEQKRGAPSFRARTMAAACGRSAEDGEACGLKEGGPHSSRVCLKRHSLQVRTLEETLRCRVRRWCMAGGDSFMPLRDERRLRTFDRGVDAR